MGKESIEFIWKNGETCVDREGQGDAGHLELVGGLEPCGHLVHDVGQEGGELGQQGLSGRLLAAGGGVAGCGLS